jgi:hypothetical protein
LAVFRDLRNGLALGIAIDIKDNEIESPEEVARRIERASKCSVMNAALGASRLWFLDAATKCCGLKMAALVRGRDRFLGR